MNCISIWRAKAPVVKRVCVYDTQVCLFVSGCVYIYLTCVSVLGVGAYGERARD